MVFHWLEAIRRGSLLNAELGFLEPYLSFHHHGSVDTKHRVEARLSWLGFGSSERTSIVADLTESELDASIAELRASLEQFPVRGELGQHHSSRR